LIQLGQWGEPFFFWSHERVALLCSKFFFLKERQMYFQFYTQNFALFSFS
jgi:hypothetical protein